MFVESHGNIPIFSKVSYLSSDDIMQSVCTAMQMLCANPYAYT